MPRIIRRRFTSSLKVATPQVVKISSLWIKQDQEKLPEKVKDCLKKRIF
jgi:hypothetical protein